LLSERLHEWYGLQWPDYSRQVDETEFLKIILEKGEEPEQNDQKVSPEDINAIRGLAETLHNIYEERGRLEKYVKINVEKLAPNTSKLTGALITAKLIALTGGIERLSKVSASTIQLLGAEKALFRHLKDGSSPPKHGIIFQHPYLHSAPYWQRGKIARALATKISIAIRVDYYKGEYQGDRFEEELKKRIENIQKRYPNAPKKEKRGKEGERKRGGEGERKRGREGERRGDRRKGKKQSKKKNWRK
jgi:nucleolar protein 56